MKLAIPADAPHLDARIGDRLGFARCLLVVDTEDLTFEVVDAPTPASGHGAGIHIITQALGMGAKVLLTGHISPHIAQTLEKSGIRVIFPVRGSVREAVESYRLGAFEREEDTAAEGVGRFQLHRLPWQGAFRKAANQFLGIFPILLGVILLLGLFQSFFPKDALLRVFSGDGLLDTLWGACAGGILTGNPLNSYVIGKTLLDLGVGLSAVTALMMAWVTVGLVQLPAETAALGLRFAMARNAAAFLITLAASPLIVYLAGVFR